MVISKFKLYAYIVPFLAVALFATIVICFIIKTAFFSDNSPLVFKVFFLAFFVYFLTFLCLGEIRHKIIVALIKGDLIEKRAYLGLGRKETFSFSELDGYVTSIISSKANSYEYLYLIKNNKKVLKLSQFYHKNYNEMKLLLIKRGIKKLRDETWSFSQENKEIFKS